MPSIVGRDLGRSKHMNQAAVRAKATGEATGGARRARPRVDGGTASTLPPLPIRARRPRAGDRAYLVLTVLGDTACLVAAWVLATTSVGPATSAAGPPPEAAIGLFVVACGLLALALVGLYDLAALVDNRPLPAALAKAGALDVVLCLAGANVLGLVIETTWIVFVSAAEFLLLLGLRELGRRAALARRADGRLARRVLLVGAGADARAFHRTVLDHPETGLTVVGVAGAEVTPPGWGAGVAWVGEGVRDVRRAADALGIDAVFVLPGAVGSGELTWLRRSMAEAHVPVHVVHDASGGAPGRLRQTRAGLGYLTHIEVDPVCQRSRALKRAIDLVAGTAVLLACLPVLAAVALAVLVLDGRPVFFRQTRVGRDLQPFRLFKFRTMARDAESLLPGLQARNEREGPLFKVADDPRVTRLGRVLRASSLDELPQLLNVVAGHMSLVGPRPAMPSEVARFGEELRTRHRVRPGVTGLWQVRSRDETSFQSYEELDLYYVENWSLALDLSILACTGPAVVSRAVAEFRRTRAPAPLPLTVDHGVAPLGSEPA